VLLLAVVYIAGAEVSVPMNSALSYN